MMMTYGPDPAPPVFVHLGADDRAHRVEKADAAAIKADRLARAALARFDADQIAAHDAAGRFRDHPTEANRAHALKAVATARRSRATAAACAQVASQLARRAVQAREE